VGTDDKGGGGKAEECTGEDGRARDHCA
jgi:hypothetical protein